MISLHLRVLGACNLGCEFCSYPIRETPWDLKRSMREVRASPARYVQVSGGEPLSAPPLGLLALLKWLRREGKTVELQTNGSLVPGYPKEHLRSIVALSHLVNINFSAHTARLDEAVTRTPGAFKLRELAIDRLLALGAKVRLTYVVYRRNLKAAPRFPDYAAKRLKGIDWIQFSFVKGMGRAQGDSKIIPPHAEAAPYIDKAMRRCGELGIHSEVDHIPVGHLPDFVNQHADTHKAFYGLKGYHSKDKAQTEVCDGCALNTACPGVRKDYLEAWPFPDASCAVLPKPAGRR